MKKREEKDMYDTKGVRREQETDRGVRKRKIEEEDRRGGREPGDGRRYE